jgi:hypothetical protein
LHHIKNAILLFSKMEGNMNRFIVFGATALAVATVPLAAVANCGKNDCSVGAFGTGGTKSGGKAQGFHLDRSSTVFPDTQIFSSGTFSAGRLTFSGSTNGTLSGYGNEATGVSSGRGTGYFGDWAGQCDELDFDEPFPDC